MMSARISTKTHRLVSPLALSNDVPLLPHAAEAVATSRHQLEAILAGKDPHRLCAIVGPCSIHDTGAALEYAAKLAEVSRSFADTLLVVMRTYFEKPRTRDGWTGLVQDPCLDDSGRIEEGLRAARSLLVKVNGLGLPCATEVLSPLVALYFEDALSWGAVGARTVDSPLHRELASGLPFPVGVKNALDGRVAPALDAVHRIQRPHVFTSIDGLGAVCVRATGGNPWAHVVLRGGSSGPNYDPESVQAAGAAACAESKLERPLLIDASHGNSGKDPTRQPAVVRAVLEQFTGGNRAVAGFLLESNLIAGRQAHRVGTKPDPRVSITDACLGWSETADLLAEAAERVRATRRPRTEVVARLPSAARQ